MAHGQAHQDLPQLRAEEQWDHCNFLTFHNELTTQTGKKPGDILDGIGTSNCSWWLGEELLRNSILGTRRKLQEIQWGMSSQNKHLKCKLSWDYHKLPGLPPLMQPMTPCVGYTDQRQLKGCRREDSKEEGLSCLAKDPSHKEENGEGKSLDDEETVEKIILFILLFPVSLCCLLGIFPLHDESAS